MNFDVYILPLLVVSVVLYAFIKKVPVFECFIKGVRKGLSTAYNIFPSITAFVVAVAMFTSSGADHILSSLMSPLTSFFGIPDEVVPLAAMSPLSGGGALTVFESVLSSSGPDSFAGRVASVMMGSTETTLYALTVYYGAASVKNTRHTLFAGLSADFTAFVMSAVFVRLFL